MDHFQSICMLFPVKDLGATFSRNSDADETLEPVEEVVTRIICNALARVPRVCLLVGDLPTSWEQSPKATNRCKASTAKKC
jgi:hypothetical protein